MKQELKEKWVAALRGGDYKQGRNALRKTNDLYSDRKEYCCLGVLCEISETGKWDEMGYYLVPQPISGSVSTSKNFLPTALLKELGIEFNNGKFCIGEKYDKYINYFSLAELNDAGFTFDQIADVIEYFFDVEPGVTVYEVQTGKGKGKYATRYTFDTLPGAQIHYGALNIHSGYKKRLVQITDGKAKTLERYIS
jgi:hypothetical protein